jgi:hypothetical protein
LQFQEQLIQEREGEIEQIEQGITELNQIFKDLGQIVGEQQSMIGELFSVADFSDRALELIYVVNHRQHRNECSICRQGYTWCINSIDRSSRLSASSW